MFAAIGRVFLAMGLFILAKGVSDALREWREDKNRWKHWNETVDDFREEMKKQRTDQ